MNPRTRSLRVIDEHGDEDEVYVNLVNRNGRVIMSLEMWQREDGRWTAQQWLQCID